MKKIYCHYCNNLSEFVDSAEIYGKSYGMVYLCRPCNAYVGVHKGTDTPFGTLANAELRKWRNLAHKHFDPVWKSGRFSGNRRGAYNWLAARMNLPEEKTHIGMFDVSQCKRVVEIMKLERNNYHGKQQQNHQQIDSHAKRNTNLRPAV